MSRDFPDSWIWTDKEPKPMTTDNPDPLEVTREMHIAVQKAIAPIILDPAFRADGWESRQMEDVAIAALRAVKPIIAQHYAPVIAREARLRGAAIKMQVAVGNVLANGGTASTELFDDLVTCQQGLAAQTKGTSAEYEAARQALGAKP